MATSLGQRTTLVCVACGRENTAAEPDGPCVCGGVLEVLHDLEWVRGRLNDEGFSHRPRTMLRYRELLPLLDVDPVLVPQVTPMHAVDRLAQRLGIRSLTVKDEGAQPSGSLKDRASAVGVARAAALGYHDVACASSGNAAASMAAMAAAHGLSAHIFVPASAPALKLLQARLYGADVQAVDGPYELAFELCDSECQANGWYNRNSGRNPYLVEGKKTCGLEIAETIGADHLDWLAVPIGDGCTVTGIWKGLREMRELGLLTSLPRLLGVQAEGASVLVSSWESDLTVAEASAKAGAPRTVADSIGVREPHNGERALRAVTESQGMMIAVPDESILDAGCLLASHSGLLPEPASAAGLAGLQLLRERGDIGAGDTAAMVMTATGLKDPQALAAV